MISPKDKEGKAKAAGGQNAPAEGECYYHKY